MGSYDGDKVMVPGDGAGLAQWLVQRQLLRDAQERLAELTAAQLVAGVPVVMPEPNGAACVQIVNRPEPTGFVGEVTMADVASFCAYVTRHATKERSSVYLNLAFGAAVPLTAVCVIDDHAATPGNRVWRAELAIRLDPQAAAVLKACTGVMTPLALAEVIEDNEEFIADPPAARLLEIATTLKAAQNARLKEAHNLANGDVAIEYVTETTATAGRGDGTLKIPEEVTLRLALFEGQAARELVLRFRYRVSDGRLVFALSCPGFAHVVKRAAEELAAELRAGVPCAVYLGQP